MLFVVLFLVALCHAQICDCSWQCHCNADGDPYPYECTEDKAKIWAINYTVEIENQAPEMIELYVDAMDRSELILYKEMLLDEDDNICYMSEYNTTFQYCEIFYSACPCFYCYGTSCDGCFYKKVKYVFEFMCNEFYSDCFLWYDFRITSYYPRTITSYPDSSESSTVSNTASSTSSSSEDFSNTMVSSTNEDRSSAATTHASFLL